MAQASEILRLLLNRHLSDYVCIPECKVGATFTSNNVRKIDLWCMAKSWKSPKTIAYEIKVSRNDFLRDDKWRNYLPYCSEFYFAAPPGIIDPSELPEEAGLIVTSKNVKRLFVKKKAPERSVDIPESIFRYILMWRTRVVDERVEQSNTEYWKQWLAEKDERKELGYNVSKKIRQLVDERIKKVSSRNENLERDNERLSKIKEILIKIDMKSVSAWNVEDKLRQKMDEINSGVPEGLLKSIGYSIEHLKRAHAILKEGERT